MHVTLTVSAEVDHVGRFFKRCTPPPHLLICLSPRVQLSVFRGPSLNSSRERASFAIAAAIFLWGEAQESKGPNSLSRIHSIFPEKNVFLYAVRSGTTSVTVQYVVASIGHPPSIWSVLMCLVLLSVTFDCLHHQRSSPQAHDKLSRSSLLSTP